MFDHNILTVVVQRYKHAITVANSFRQALDTLVKRGGLVGFTLTDLPATVDKSIQGFELSFADRRLRFVVTGSTAPQNSVAIEVWRVPLAYGSDLKLVFVLLVSKDGEAKLQNDETSYWIEHPNDAHGILCRIVSEVAQGTP